MAEQKKQRLKQPEEKYSMSEDAAEIVGYYSVDGDRNFIPDSSQLLYFNPPEETEVYMDLNKGIESAVCRDANFQEEGMDLFLKWLELNHEKLKANNPISGRHLQPKFICTRGILTTLLSTGCMPDRGWTIYAAKWKGNIYLCFGKSNNEYSQNTKGCSWGFKFEQYVLSASPDQPPDTSKPVVEPAEFRCVYQRHIGNHTVLFSSVTKGLCSKTALKDPLPLEKLKFIDTKTNIIIEHPAQERALRKNKYVRWWAQCYLTDTQEVLCGFRDDSGIVRKLRRYDIRELVKLSKDYSNPKTSIDFCQSFLTEVSETVITECDKTLYRFEKIPNQGIKSTNLFAGNRHRFIDETFMEALR